MENNYFKTPERNSPTSRRESLLFTHFVHFVSEFRATRITQISFGGALIVVLVLMGTLASCGRADRDKASEEPSSDEIQREYSDTEHAPAGPVADMSFVSSRKMIPSPAGFTSEGTFTGTLPCADCSGIQTELTLFTHSDNGHQRYILQQTYLSTRTGDETFWNSGVWESFTDAAGNQILRLDRGSEERMSFQVTGSRVIRMLDLQEQKIESQLNYSLYKLPQ